MKKRFMTILLAAVLTLGLCGCGSSGTSLPTGPMSDAEAEKASTHTTDDVLPEVWYTADDLLEMWDAGTITKEEIAEKAAAGEMNDATFEEMMKYIEKEEEYAARIEAIRASDEGWSVYDLIDLYYAGALSKEEVAEMVATGEISSETFEEFLARIEWDGEPTMQSEMTSDGDNSTKDADTLELLDVHVLEFTDSDGYEIRETIQLSPIFTEDDTETMYALWEALGNDVSSFPSEESLYSANRLLRDARDSYNCNELEYIIGTYMVENLTDEFPITSDNPRTYTGVLLADRESPTDQEQHNADAATFFNIRSSSMVTYSNNATYYGEQDLVILGRAKMNSDIWGLTHFVIALPNETTPNRPNGYLYDDITIQFGDQAHFYAGSDTFGLSYFTKGDD